MEKVPEIFCELPPGGVNNGQPTEARHISGAAAQVATSKLWANDVLKFHILNSNELRTVDLNADNIISWAEKWTDTRYKNIPKLIFTDDPDEAKIRIKICKLMYLGK